MKYIVTAIVIAASLSACSAIKTMPTAQTVELSNAQPSGSCQYVGEALGSQGNWFTGDYTSNQNLMAGARNDLRNKAAAMGGNYVWIQNVSNAQAHGAMGTSNTTTVGNVYRCTGGVNSQPQSYGTLSPTPTVAGRQSITTPTAGEMDSSITPAAPSNDVQTILQAQNVAASQGCNNLRAHPGGGFEASCANFTLVIACSNGTCRPVRAVNP